jgi:hypothetical protein
MKILPLLTALSVLPVAGISAASFVTESATEFLAPGDFDDDGDVDLAVVDRATGVIRVAYRVGANSVTQGNTVASGASQLTSVSVGLFDSVTKSSLALTAPEVNAVVIVSPENPQNTVPERITTLSGPRSAAAIDVGGGGNTPHDDLAISSGFGVSDLSLSFQSLRNAGGSFAAPGASSSLSQRWEMAHAFTPQTGQPQVLGLVDRFSGNFRMVTPELSSMTTHVTQSVSAGAYWASGMFGGATAADLFFWVPNSTIVQTARVGGSAGAWTLSSTVSYSFTSAVKRLMIFQIPSGQSRVFLVFADGTAGIADYVHGTGFGSLRSVNLAGLSGAAIQNAVALDGGYFMTSVGSGSSSSLALFSDDGFTTVLQQLMPLRSITARSAAPTLMLFDQAPLRNESAVFLGSLRAGDWSTGTNLGGLPPTASSLTFQSSSTGLGGAFSAQVDPLPAGTGAALVNQVHAQMSLFATGASSGVVENEVLAEPAPGSHNESVRVTLTARSTAGATIRYRRGTTGLFSNYLGPIFITSDTELQVYVLQAGESSAVQTLSYTFTQAAEKMDSDGDGVPDFVENARGLDPTAGEDSDGDGYTDLEELRAGTDPANAAAMPLSRSDTRDHLQLTVSPQSIDPNAIANDVAALAGTTVRVYDVAGTLLGRGVLEGAATSVTLDCQPITDAQRLLVVTTDNHFPINTTDADKNKGRELVGLVAVPAQTPVEVAFTYNPALSMAAQATNWVTAADIAYDAATAPVVTESLNPEDALSFALTEAILGEALSIRGLSSTQKVVFTPWRATDVARSSTMVRFTSAGELVRLEGPLDSPFYFNASHPPAFVIRSVLTNVQAMMATPSSGMTQLKALAREIYRISAQLNNASPGTYDLPLDALRQVVQFSVVPASYSAATTLTSEQLTAALTTASSLRYSSGLQRVAVTRSLSFMSSSSADTLAQSTSGTATTYSLLDLDGSPYEVPEQWTLNAGSVVEVVGYEDTATRHGYPTITVARATVQSLNLPSRVDSDGDLLADAWELLNFGSLTRSTYDEDTAGYSMLHEFLAQTDPGDTADAPSGGPVDLTLTSLGAVPLPPSSLRFHAQWWTGYEDQIQVQVWSSSDLSHFTNTGTTAEALGGGIYRADVGGGGSSGFYQMRAALRP